MVRWDRDREDRRGALLRWECAAWGAWERTLPFGEGGVRVWGVDGWLLMEEWDGMRRKCVRLIGEEEDWERRRGWMGGLRCFGRG